MPERRPYGLWESPITPAALAGGLRLRGPSWDSDGRTLGWFEGRGDRGVVVVAALAGEASAARDITSDHAVRAGVGYGGGDSSLAHGNAWFVGHDSQRIHRQFLHDPAATARPITPTFGEASSPAVSPDGRWVAYVHSFEDEDVIAVVSSSGEGWPQHLARGRDFYMQPVWSPGGDRLAWVEWDHPNMPWDGSELRVGELAFPEGSLPAIARSEVVAGGADIAVLQPAFSPDGGALSYVSDETGWGHLYRHDLATGERSALTSGDCEYGTPSWGQGVATFAVLPSGRVVATRQRQGFARLVLIEDGGEARELDIPADYASFENPVASPTAERLAVLASGPATSLRLLVINLEEGAPEVTTVRLGDPEAFPAAGLSLPEPVSWTNTAGSEVHGLYYPPASERFEDHGPPPLVVFVHGGPTDHVDAGWRPQIQFLASRGYAVLAVNYRGSSGAGRETMLALRGEWGVADVEDCRAGAEAMTVRGLADGDRLAIMGGSAGGYTVLRSLQVHPGFYRAGVCYYGISNLFTLASDTHKFEARYLDSLVGPLPDASSRYRERSPIFHAHAIADPIALFQGTEDRVVPRDQSDSLAATLRSRRVPHEYHVYEGEGHGWRKPETVDAFYTSVDRFLRRYLLG